MTDSPYISSGGCIYTIRVRPDGTITNRSQHPLDTLRALSLASPDRIPITPAQYDRLKAMRYARWVDGDVVEGPPPDDALGKLKAGAIRKIDRDAEAARNAWATPGSGQAFEYDLVAAEAERFVRDGEGDALFDDYPLLAAEFTARATAGQPRRIIDIARAVMDKRRAFVVAIADIRQTRLEAKMRIDAVTDAAQIETVLAGVEWPTPGAVMGRNG